ncbi:MAG TPA: rRNA maturation RNase YbeY [Acidobacteriota bacterium]
MITVVNRQSRYRISLGKFKALLEKLVRRYRLKDPEISLSFVGPDRIRALNRRYLKKDKPTDVLSFPLGEKAADGRYYLGDIVIAPEKAQRQSLGKGRSLEREMEILTVHGFLHLLGYDHLAGIEEEEAKVHKTLSLRPIARPAARGLSPQGARSGRKLRPKKSARQKPQQRSRNVTHKRPVSARQKR